MSRLVPTSTTTIPVSQATEGYDVAKLVVEKHEFPAPQQPAREKIAFLWSHANGFNKEVMHPLMRRFLTQLRKLEQYNHTDVHFIAWDARNHGDSARLNEGHHTPKFSWFDHAMDTKQIIDELDLKSYDKLIGVGHSFGATSMILCEFLYPKTFDGLTILEPVIHGELPPLALRLQFPAIAVTLKRRDTWDSREECMKSLAGRSFWKAFHHEVLENYVQYGLYHTADGKVKLKCPKEQEHLVYMNGAYGAVTAFAALRTITIPLHFVHANFSGYVDPKFGETIKKQSPLITNAYVDGTHVVPLENPDILVPEIIRLTERVREQGVRAKL